MYEHLDTAPYEINANVQWVTPVCTCNSLMMWRCLNPPHGLHAGASAFTGAAEPERVA